jgi:hypothetical protein
MCRESDDTGGWTLKLFGSNFQRNRLPFFVNQVCFVKTQMVLFWNVCAFLLQPWHVIFKHQRNTIEAGLGVSPSGRVCVRPGVWSPPPKTKQDKQKKTSVKLDKTQLQLGIIHLLYTFLVGQEFSTWTDEMVPLRLKIKCILGGNKWCAQVFYTE